MEENNQNNNNNPNGNKPRRPGFTGTLILLIISAILTLIFWQQFNKFRSSDEEEVSYDTFITMVDEGKVEKIEIYNTKIFFTPKEQTDRNTEKKFFVIRTDDLNLVDRLAKSGVKFSQIDEGVFKKLGVNQTCEARYESKKLYHK